MLFDTFRRQIWQSFSGGMESGIVEFPSFHHRSAKTSGPIAWGASTNLPTKDLRHFLRSVKSNMITSIEQHVDFVTDALLHMREHGFELMEPELEAASSCPSAVSDGIGEYARKSSPRATRDSVSKPNPAAAATAG